MADEDDGAVLDYSSISPGLDEGLPSGETMSSNLEEIRPEVFGTRTPKGQFVLKDLDDEVHAILTQAKSKSNPGEEAAAPSGLIGSGLSTISGMLRSVIGGKMLTGTELDNAMKGMEEHLINKNVAREAAVRLCDGVRTELTGIKTGNFESIAIVIFSLMHSDCID